MKNLFLFLLFVLLTCPLSGQSQKAGRVELHESVDGEYYMRIIARNGRETWRTSEMYQTRAGAIKATHSAARVFGCAWNGKYVNHVYRPMSDSEFYKRYPGAKEGRWIVK